MRRKDRPLRRSALEASTSERLSEIVEAAERAAKQVIDEAEAEGRRQLSEAEVEADRIVAERLDALSGVADSLVSQAEALRRQSERLLEALEQARAELSTTTTTTTTANGAAGVEGVPADPPEDSRVDWVTRGSHLTAVPLIEHPSEEEAPPPVAAAPTPPAPDREGPAGARLLATQMAVSGSSREEIEARLRNGFEIDDTDAILDAILGPED
jgi:vacuolar-type H+-ATPase subunit H